MNAQKEVQIISQVQSGQSEPFAQLVHFYQHQLFRIVGNMVGLHAAEDVVQETFLTAFKNIGRYDARRALFRTWLFRIARNQALNFLKKRKHDQLPVLPEIQTVKTPVDQVLQKEAFMQLDRALASLKFSDRIIFVLSEIEGLSYAEIARIEGVRLGTVKSRLARCRAKLKTLIEGFLDCHEK